MYPRPKFGKTDDRSRAKRTSSFLQPKDESVPPTIIHVAIPPLVKDSSATIELSLHNRRVALAAARNLDPRLYHPRRRNKSSL